MKKLLLFCLTFISFISFSSAQIIISQYVETNSGSTPKGIELLNVSGAIIDFSVTNLVIEKGTNGATPSTDFTLSTGTLADGEVIVVGTSDLNFAYTCGAFHLKAFTFNGDDALVIKLGGTITDVFGTSGSDPGSGWSGNGVATNNQNIQLKSGITTGDTDGWTDPSIRFETVGVGTTTTGFGEPTDGCPSASGESTISFDAATSSVVEGTGSNTTHNVPVTMDTEPSANVTADVSNTNGNTNNGDYTLVTTSLTFPTGGTYPMTQNVEVTITGDSNTEGSETFNLTISLNAANDLLADISSGSHTVTITDDDVPTSADIRINEVDADTPGSDVAEFVELYSSTPNYALDGFVLVIFDGSDDASRLVYDLDGYSTDASGYFLIGMAGAATPSPEYLLGSSFLQNGTEAVALYLGNASDFPSNTPATTSNLVDALVHHSNDANNPTLQSLLGLSEQIDESVNGSSGDHSIQRGSWFVAPPTPRALNMMLPIDLSKFTAKKANHQVNLAWQTSTEINNDHFNIQHSTDGRNFQTLEKIAGAGNSNKVLDYIYTHSTPTTGLNFYRLEQVDFDGTATLSAIISVRMTDETGIQIYPTLANTELTIAFDELPSNTVLATIYNQVGQVISTQELANKSVTQTISVANLRNGHYIISLQYGQTNLTKRFVKF